MMMKRVKKQFQLVRPLDIIIIILLFIASFIPHVVFAVQHSNVDTEAEIIAIVSIDGEEVDRFILSEDTPNELVTYYPSGNQYNIIEVDGTRIRVKEDNSPDQIAVMTGWISQPGETSICLPHRLIIEVRSSEPDGDQENDVIIPL